MSNEDVESTISLRDLHDSKELIAQLAYPSHEVEYGLMILRELEHIQVESIYIVREPKISLRFLGKGYRGVILKVSYRGIPSIVKILRTDSTISSLRREAEMIKFANSIFIGPRLYDYSEHTILMEYIDGVNMEQWLDALNEDDKHSLVKILREVFEQARKMDEINLDHGELSNPRKHVLIKRDLSLKIIDFGKASVSHKPKNVTSIFSYIIYGQHSGKLLRMLQVEEPPIDVIKMYKEKRDKECFEKIIERLNLKDV
ncbi:MAG: hypothetical protein NZ929_05670 [Aigarchaeota archaeon]|nr:hypothetical protein [Aigarchaeota archaeon]MCX8193288.1 hypothetical protein [Nitrososphaeria archaeon]MDW7986507.1 RIO1 family regulatory kinase/ATPase [Nitrososphaerota archaeon]